jgi:hypothetical protein
MNIRELYQSFQKLNVKNSAIVAIPGSDSGSTTLNKMVYSFAPSIFADSISAEGIDVEKKVLRITTYHEFITLGTISAHIVLLSFKTFAHIIYHDTIPPLKSMVKKEKNANKFRYLKSFLDSGYAYNATMSTPITVPNTVVNIVTTYALKIVCLADDHMYLYASKLHRCGKNEYPLFAIADCSVRDVIITNTTGMTHISARKINNPLITIWNVFFLAVIIFPPKTLLFPDLFYGQLH